MNVHFIFYFKRMPKRIEQFVQSNKQVCLNREGVKPWGSSAFPRATIRIEGSALGVDKDLVRVLKVLLQKLKDEQSIISFYMQG